MTANDSTKTCLFEIVKTNNINSQWKSNYNSLPFLDVLVTRLCNVCIDLTGYRELTHIDRCLIPTRTKNGRELHLQNALMKVNMNFRKQDIQRSMKRSNPGSL